MVRFADGSALGTLGQHALHTRTHQEHVNR